MAPRERARARLGCFFREFDERLGESESVAGPRWTVADATAPRAVDFAGWPDAGIRPGWRNLARWHGAVSARPSAET